jgi:ribonuclease BN (tRNA processing enzyme)
MQRDRDQAQRTQHLSTGACAEIANKAEVGQLLPFHFSKRYLRDVPAVYRELAELCPVTVIPRQLSPLTEQPSG